MTSFGFGTITSQGVGSNLNLAGIVTDLMAIERIPLDRLIAQKTSFDAKISSLGTIKSSLSSFQSALAGLKTGTSILANMATSSNTSILTATGTSGAVAGNYTISDIEFLAQQQKLVAAGQADATATIGVGTTTTLTFDLGEVTGGVLAGGTYTGATYTSGGAGTFDVVIDNTNNTLEGIRDAINMADGGVTATIVNDGDATNPYRLVLSSTVSGVDQSIQITSTGGDATVEALLTHDSGNDVGQNLSETVTAQDALFKVDGISITKSSNTVTDVISGVTLNLAQAAGLGTSLTVSVSQDTDSAKTAIEAFITAYNDLREVINSETDRGVSGSTAGGALSGDSATRQIINSIRDELNQAPTGITGSYTTLSSIGVSFQRDGTLALDETVLNTAMQADSNNVAELFSAADGYATRLDSVVEEMLVFNGIIDSRTNVFKDRISNLEDRQVTLESRLERIEARMRQRFTALDVLVASLSSTNTALAQQLKTLDLSNQS